MKPATRVGRRFVIDGHRGEASFRDMMQWQLSGKRANWPSRIANAPQPPPPRRVEGDDIGLTWIGHSTVLVQAAGLNILTDPFLSQRASPMQWAGPKRVRPPGLGIENFPPIDVVLVSHNHYDHMDLPALRRIARDHRPHVVTPLGNARHIRKAGRHLEIDELDWGGSIRHGGIGFTLTPTLHWSKRGLFDTNRDLWGAFVIQTGAGMIYFAGDTGYGEGQTFRDVRAEFGPPRVSLLPIGAYEPRWFMRPHHMNPDEAVAAHLELGSRTSLAIHHGTVQLTDEAVDAPARALAGALALRGVDEASFLVPEVGEPILIS